MGHETFVNFLLSRTPFVTAFRFQPCSMSILIFAPRLPMSFTMAKLSNLMQCCVPWSCNLKVVHTAGLMMPTILLAWRFRWCVMAASLTFSLTYHCTVKYCSYLYQVIVLLMLLLLLLLMMVMLLMPMMLLNKLMNTVKKTIIVMLIVAILMKRTHNVQEMLARQRKNERQRQRQNKKLFYNHSHQSYGR